MSQTKSATTVEQLVSETDHVQLSRLVTEHAWRADHGRADTIHELYVDDGELIVGPTPLRGREAILEWGRQLRLSKLGAPTLAFLPGIRFGKLFDTCARPSYIT
jgi:SnoaL-like domain